MIERVLSFFNLASIPLNRQLLEGGGDQCSSRAGPAHGPWAGLPMGWAGLEFVRNEWALDGPGLEFLNCMNNAAGEIIYIKSNFIVLFNTVE